MICGPAASRPSEGTRKFWPWLAILLVLGATALWLHGQGRPWWCACGRLSPWVSDPRSSHTSQHLLDPYSFTHVLHGVLLCGLLAWISPRLPGAWRLCVAVTIESLWEGVENSAFVIQRYRTATAALGYEGDTLANSLGDILSCIAGFMLARRLGLRGSILLVVITEVVLLLWIRDNLFLSVLMLFCPVKAIKAWQGGS